MRVAVVVVIVVFVSMRVGMFVSGVVGVVGSLAGEGDGVHHVLHVLVSCALRPPVHNLLESCLIDGGHLVSQAAGLLEESSDLAGVVLVHRLRARL
jgi:hypothetical protein